MPNSDLSSPMRHTMPMPTWIVRVRRGRVPSALGWDCLALMESVAIPDCRRISGNMGAFCWHRTAGDSLEVNTVLWWRDLAAIQSFAGEGITAAKHYPFDAQFLLEMDPYVTHFDCFGLSF